MGVKKGMDNFAAARAASVEANLRVIHHFLDKRKHRGAIYPDLKSLVADVAEASNLHRTTLTRKGSKYLRALLSYLAAQPGASEVVPDAEATPELLRKKLMDARMEISLLKKQLEQVQLSGAPVGLKTPGAPVTDWYVAFADSAMVLRDLMARVNEAGETIRLDTSKKVLVDLAAPPSRRAVSEGIRLEKLCEFYERLDAQVQPTVKAPKNN